jgi:hypothetical protein
LVLREGNFFKQLRGFHNELGKLPYLLIIMIISLGTTLRLLMQEIFNCFEISLVDSKMAINEQH